MVVKEYLAGGISQQSLAKKYGILAPSTIGSWVKAYNNHEELTESRPKGEYLMIKENKSRKTTLEERLAIVEYCTANNHNYALTAKEYHCSYPAYVAENVLNREFHAEKLNEKWVTDVSEFKYGTGEDEQKGKIYLSVILDLCDRRPVSYVYGDHNDNPLVFTTFDKAMKESPGATPIFHSDRGYQYTSKEFRKKIVDAGMTQSMSRVAHCIDNGPMEGFWGIMKREMYYGHKFKTKEELLQAIEEYMTYYTTKRVQRKLNVMTPMEYHEIKLKEAA